MHWLMPNISNKSSYSCKVRSDAQYTKYKHQSIIICNGTYAHQCQIKIQDITKTIKKIIILVFFTIKTKSTYDWFWWFAQQNLNPLRIGLGGFHHTSWNATYSFYIKIIFLETTRILHHKYQHHLSIPTLSPLLHHYVKTQDFPNPLEIVVLI